MLDTFFFTFFWRLLRVGCAKRLLENFDVSATLKTLCNHVIQANSTHIIITLHASCHSLLTTPCEACGTESTESCACKIVWGNKDPAKMTHTILALVKRVLGAQVCRPTCTELLFYMHTRTIPCGSIICHSANRRCQSSMLTSRTLAAVHAQNMHDS